MFPLSNHRLLLAAVAIAGITGNPAHPAWGAAAATPAEQYLLSAANGERAALGLRPLRPDARLALAAQGHARAMAERATIAHQFPGEPALAVRASTVGLRFSVVEENVGEAPSALTIHELWMRSLHHRDNLLDPAVDSAGISVIARNGQLYAVEDFAKTVPPASFAQQETAIAALVSQRGVAVLDTEASILDARQTCTLSSGYAGSHKPWFIMRFTSDTLNTLPAELTARIASGRLHRAAVGACDASSAAPFTSYRLAVLLYP